MAQPWERHCTLEILKRLSPSVALSVVGPLSCKLALNSVSLNEEHGLELFNSAWERKMMVLHSERHERMFSQ